MRPVTVTVAGVGNSSPVVLDRYISPFQVSIGVTVSGSVDYKLQYSYDDPFSTAGLVNWTDSTLMTGKTTASDTVLNAAPVTAVRLVNADTGTITARVIQAGGGI